MSSLTKYNIGMILETSNGRTDEIVLIDKADYNLVGKYKWQILRKPRDGYVTKYVWAITSYYKKEGLTKSRYTYLHRMIMQPQSVLVVDHIDGNGLNNRRTNLRVVSKSQNSLNRHNFIHVKNLGESKEKSQFRRYA